MPYYEGITLLDVLRDVKFKEKPRYLKAVIFRENNNKEGYKEYPTYKNQNLLNKNNLITNSINKRFIAENNQNFIDKNLGLKDQYDNSYFTKKEKKVVYLYDLLIKGSKEENITLKEGDSILIKKVENTEKDKTVTILGEVNRPGIYKYKSGMRLYDLILEAGGYTEDAYPKALIFIRESAKKLQQEQLQASILSMEESLSKSSEGLEAAGATAEEQALAKMYIEKQKRLLNIIKQKAKLGLGRVALDIPNSLEELKYSKDNIQLQDGDFIYIPAKPNYILVLGDVYNQISLPYRKDFTVEDYLKEVGGAKENAKEDDIYIIKANGRVVSKRNFDSSFIKWQDDKLYIKQDFYSMKLEQGDTIVVPTELKIPVMWRPLLRDITQIIFQSISTAVLAKRL
ncbi:SLBB domain-containing protein [Hydrogenothermus marinus]|uniref:SLBB domain-containing protein n=1 Tax=Hydrogenothermus marinus TaxID=133270 RepID=UPI000EFA1FC5